MNRVDVVDLVDVDLDVDLVDVVSLSSGCILILGPRQYFCLLAPGCILIFGLRLFREYFPPAVFGASLYCTTSSEC